MAQSPDELGPSQDNANAQTAALTPEELAKLFKTVPNSTQETLPPDVNSNKTFGRPPASFGGTRTDATLDVDARTNNSLDIQPSQRRAAAIMRTAVGDYEILNELGRGGMGVVYRARHTQLNREVALKMILAGAHASEIQVQRFLIEARAVARLQHPNIVQIFDIGHQDNLPYFSLEYVDGTGLAQKIRQETLSPEAAAKLVETLALAMQYAHDHGILHRDLKPANVLMTSTDVPKISDFGLAKELEDDDSGSTRTGTIMGTPSYMAPEQARGDVHALGPATDQYSLGAILYELLVGRPPFLGAKPVETILQVLKNEPVSPRQLQPKLPIDLETICLKALQKDPARRYANCREFAEDLRRFQRGETILARPVGNVERLARWCKRNPKVAALAATTFLFLTLTAVISTWSATSLQAKNTIILQEKQKANQEAENAMRQKAIAEDKQQVAINQASLALETIQTLIDKVMNQIGDTPNTQSLKKDLLETALQGAERVTEHNKQTSREATIMAARQKLGELYYKLGEVDKAFTEYDYVYQQALERAKTQGGTEASRYNAASSTLKMADMYREVKRDMANSQLFIERSIAAYNEILDNPKPGYGAIPHYAIRLAMLDAYNRLAIHFVRMGDPAKALEEFRRCRQILAAVAEIIEDDQQLEPLEPDARKRVAPDRPRIKAGLPQIDASALLGMGGMLHRLRKPSEAEPYYRQSMGIREQLYAAAPKDPNSKFNLARVVGMLGEFFFQSGRTDDAEPLFQRAAVIVQELASADEKNTDYRRDLGIAHYRLGQLYARKMDNTKSAEHFKICRELREGLVDNNAPNVKRQMELMLVLAHCGEHVVATELAEKLQQGTNDNELLLDVTRCYAQCSKVVAVQPELVERYTRKALETLKTVREGGYNDLFNLEVDPDFDPLRGNPEFQKLIAAAPLPSS